MIEVPVNDTRHRQFVQRRYFLAEAFCREAELQRSLDDVDRLAPVARNSASNAQSLERNPCAVMGQHHRERGGTALHCFHLQDGWGPPDRSTTEPPSIVSKHQPTISSTNVYPEMPVSRLN